MSDSRLFSNILSVFNTKIIVLLLGLVGTVLISRGLGADGRGMLAALLIYPQLLVSVFEGGMRQSTVLFLGKKKATEAEVLGSAFTFTLVSSFIGYFFVLSLMFNFEHNNYDYILFVVSGFVLPISLAVSTLKGYFLGLQKIQRFNSLAWIEKSVYAIGVVILYFTGHVDVTSVLFLTVISSLINLILGFWFFFAIKPKIGLFKFKTFKSMFQIGIVYGIALFLIDVNYKVDILLINWLSTFDELGRYTLSVKLGELLWQLPGAIVVVLLSKGANSSAKTMVPIVVKTIRITLFVTSILALGLCVFCFLFVVPIFGEGFESVPLIVTVLIPGLLFMVVFKSINSFFAGQGKPQYSIYIMVVAVVVNILLNILLIPKLGAVGAAIASDISYLLSSVIMLMFFCKKEQVKVSDIILTKKSDFEPLINRFFNKNSC